MNRKGVLVENGDALQGNDGGREQKKEDVVVEDVFRVGVRGREASITSHCYTGRIIIKIQNGD